MVWWSITRAKSPWQSWAIGEREKLTREFIKESIKQKQKLSKLGIFQFNWWRLLRPVSYWRSMSRSTCCLFAASWDYQDKQGSGVRELINAVHLLGSSGNLRPLRYCLASPRSLLTFQGPLHIMEAKKKDAWSEYPYCCIWINPFNSFSFCHTQLQEFHPLFTTGVANK